MTDPLSDALPDSGPYLSLARLRALSAVSDEGSYAAAARRLGLSHSAVSQQVREMEAQHGVKLFERVSGLLRPTPICLELTDIGARIREAERDAARILDRRDERGNKRLRIGLGNAMPGIAIAGLMAAHYPDVSVVVQTGSHHDVMAAVLRRDVDLALLPDVPPDPRFRRFPVVAQEVVAIAAADSPHGGRDEIGLEELSRLPLIFRTSGSSTQKVVDRAFRRAGLDPMPRLVADTRDAVYEAVAVGLGIGFMWRHGTIRTDAVRRLAVPGLGPPAEEALFTLAADRNPLVDLFFSAAAEYSRSPRVARA